MPAYRSEIDGLGDTAPSYPLIKTCAFGVQTAKPVLLFGDSHAGALYEEFGRQLGAMNRGGLLVKDPYCPPAFGLYDRSKMPAEFVASCDNASQAADVKSAAVAAFISKLAGLNVPAIGVYPVPETGWDIPRRNHRRIILGLPVEAGDLHEFCPL